MRDHSPGCKAKGSFSPDGDLFYLMALHIWAKDVLDELTDEDRKRDDVQLYLLVKEKEDQKEKEALWNRIV